MTALMVFLLVAVLELVSALMFIRWLRRRKVLEDIMRRTRETMDAIAKAHGL